MRFVSPTASVVLLAVLAMLSSCQPAAVGQPTTASRLRTLTPNWTHPPDLAATLHTPTLTLRATRDPSLTAMPTQQESLTPSRVPPGTMTARALLATNEASASADWATRSASFSPTPTRTPTSTAAPLALHTPTAPLPFAPPTVTPAPSAACPEPVPALGPELDVESLRNLRYGDRRRDVLLDFFNRGGTTYALRSALSRGEQDERAFHGEVERLELTNDGRPEVLVTIHIPEESESTRLIYSCQGGEMRKLLTLISDTSAGSGVATRIQSIEDINGNGLPELLISTASIGASGTQYWSAVFEWDGQELTSLVDPSWRHGISVFGGDANIGDPDQDGQKELTAFGVHDSLIHRCGEISTTVIDTWEWNGEYYVRARSSFLRRTYRLQAAMEGDWALLHQRYEQAARAYQAAIFDESLEPSNYLQFGQEYCADSGGQYQQIEGFSALEERSILEAYSRFRLVQLRLLQGNLSTAKVLLAELQQRHPDGEPGDRFTRLAETQLSAAYQGSSTRESCDLLLEASSSLLPDLPHPINHIRSDLYVFPTNIRIPFDRYLCPFK